MYLTPHDHFLRLLKLTRYYQIIIRSHDRLISDSSHWGNLWNQISRVVLHDVVNASCAINTGSAVQSVRLSHSGLSRFREYCASATKEFEKRRKRRKRRRRPGRETSGNSDATVRWVTSMSYFYLYYRIILLHEFEFFTLWNNRDLNANLKSKLA